MTSKTPSRRLTDVLRSNSKETLLRNAAELAKVSVSLPPEKIQTRFLRNRRLINPKSLRLLCDEGVLSRWCAFAVYKPPFCPMRRAEAGGNYHRVSVESFIEAALRSREVQPVLQRELRPEEVRVRVVNDVDVHASGPVLVTVADRHAFATSLRGFTMRYDVLVAGHLPLTEPRRVDANLLLEPSCRGAAGGDSDDAVSLPPPCAGAAAASSSSSSSSSCVCTYQVKRNAYYSVHPVSLLEFTVTAPPTPLPPRIEAYVRENLDTFVLGDPDAAVPQAAAVAGGGAGAAKTSWGVVALRGDCDFPRVFTHLREVCIDADAVDAAGGVATKTVVDFHCRKCFEPVLQRERVYSLKGRRIGLLDGSWTPEAEFL
ncbi:hypothetical protein DQ04_08411030 [Trypanosoma grayi]|uniref:hypothetical protein n=1 Tax=Trypanosoma grayi TaxID=71804 RepID=UPI0004F42D1C|nr:hypothetical protein DQ04_08411030 [Trypanosoma grayi]KEG07947.1 hypothetical protein DQ04_08411030 [Trypanosoma grayi]